MQLVGGHIRRRVAAGTLPVETLETLAAASCVFCPPITGVGRVVNSDGTVPALEPGTSEGAPRGDPKDGRRRFGGQAPVTLAMYERRRYAFNTRRRRIHPISVAAPFGYNG